MKIEKQTQDKGHDFTALCDCLAVYSDAANRVSEIEARCNEQLLQIVDEERKEYADLQRALTEAETALEVIARRHPEWFVARKSVKTPYGAVAFRIASRLEVPNEEVTVLLIEQDQELADKRDALLRQTKTVNLEALGELDDQTLRRLRVKRVTDESFSVKPAKLDLGKAVKEAAEATAKG